MASRAPSSLADLRSRRIVIVGAGPTGLGAAWRLAELDVPHVTVYEREPYPGGLAASFRDDAGFTWDVGGHVQFSHYGYFDRVMDRVMGDEWLHHERESWIWIRDRFVPYPLQRNIQCLPDAEKRACVLGLLRRTAGGSTANFRDWIIARFGTGLAETFLLPYNAKVWACPPEEMDFGWVGERVAEVDLERVVLNLLDGRPDVSWGPNSRFRFPARNGTGEIWRRVAAALPGGVLRYGRQVVAIDAERSRIQLDGGEAEPFDVLLSTMPLDCLAAAAGGRFAPLARGLRHSGVHVVGIGLRGTAPPAFASKCWIYFPEDVCPYYRLTVFSNYSPHNVPDAATTWSVMVEVSESPSKSVDHGRLRESVVDGLIATRVIESHSQVLSYWHHFAPHGYPTPFLGRDAVVDPLIEAFEQHAIFSRGRFGAWKYEVSNQDHSFMQGVECVDRLAFGSEETTLHRPHVVNGRS